MLLVITYLRVENAASLIKLEGMARRELVYRKCPASHAPHVRQAILHDLPSVLHAPLHCRFSCPLPLHSRLHALSVESHSLMH